MKNKSAAAAASCWAVLDDCSDRVQTLREEATKNAVEMKQLPSDRSISNPYASIKFTLWEGRQACLQWSFASPWSWYFRQHIHRFLAGERRSSLSASWQTPPQNRARPVDTERKSRPSRPVFRCKAPSQRLTLSRPVQISKISNLLKIKTTV